jgi:hypothetical protein
VQQQQQLFHLGQWRIVVVVGGTDGVFIFPTVKYTHHHHHHHPIIISCPSTMQNRKSPDDGPLDKIRIPPKMMTGMRSEHPKL